MAQWTRFLISLTKETILLKIHTALNQARKDSNMPDIKWNKHKHNLFLHRTQTPNQSRKGREVLDIKSDNHEPKFLAGAQTVFVLSCFIMVVPRSRGWHYLCLLSVGTGVALQADPGLAEPCAVWALEVRICRWDTGCQVAAFSGGLCLMATLFL